jgi:3-deoxy-D-manno-octulosonate 8-phosphate phosphatase KdsC-like HAD superfamily phosphatase
MAFAPADAHPSVDTATTWKLNANGGAGAARELADLLLHSQASPLS